MVQRVECAKSASGLGEGTTVHHLLYDDHQIRAEQSPIRLLLTSVLIDMLDQYPRTALHCFHVLLKNL